VTAPALYGLYIAFALLGAGVYLAMPSEGALGRRLFWSGRVLAAAGLAGVAVYLARWLGGGFDGRVFFVLFALLAIAAAIRVVTHRRPVYSAVYLILVVLATTGLCVLAAAEFLAASLVIVYGGAILVTYVFVIMLAQQAGEADYDARSHEPLAAVILGFALVAATTQAMVSTDPLAGGATAGRSAARLSPARPPAATTAPAEPGNVRQVGIVLIRDHLLAVQVAGVLMLIAMAGAIAVARKRILPAARTAHEQEHVGAARHEPVGRHVAPFAKVQDSELR
jgi:NADH-quinone oxidoreductase subunit J